ncbi:MAG: hypothetical protein FWC42_07445 [Proteobacteria bacterium]|nr:hypothetical protein [Pseudomonadota bacterium]
MKKHPLFFNTLFALVVLLATSLPTSAFIPDYPLAAVPGEHHKRITLEALDEIYAAYGYGPGLASYTNNMKDARETIAQGSADTDHLPGIKDDPNWHCDDERLSGCSNTVKSQTDNSINDIKKASYDTAREKIGRVTHTLQDFYAHSNWVETRGSTVNPEMGYGNLSNLALLGDRTCNPSTVPGWAGSEIACLYMQSENILVPSNKLTSGYFVANSSGTVPTGKCSHGGSLDGGLLGPDLRDGINKDAAVCWFGPLVISPHSLYHHTAAAAAKSATVEYFQKIKARVDEEDFKKFLGFGPSLGFAIDTTGSMANDIAGVKNSVYNIIMNRLGTDEEPSEYVLSIINDPVVPPAMKTPDYTVFLNKLLSLYAGYGGDGGDCPELYGQGTYNAVAALSKGSTLLTYTDASIKDNTNALLALMLASSKNIKVITGLSGSCESEKAMAMSAGMAIAQGQENVATAKAMLETKAYLYNDLYYTISEMTGGQVFIISKSEAGKLAELSDILFSNYYTGLMSVADNLTSGSAKSYEFNVDSRTDKLSISISLLKSANVTVLRPDGTTVSGNDFGVDVLSLSQAVSFEIDKPAVGNWKVILDGDGKFTVNVAGSSPLSFDKLRFVELGGRLNLSYYEIVGYPVAGAKQNVEATVSDDTSDVHFEFRAKNGTLLSSVVLNVVDAYPGTKTVFMSEDVVLPTEPFRVYAVGKDANGNNFQRVLSNVIVPQTVAVKGPENQNLPLDTDTVYTFKVTNYGKADNFLFAAIDDRGFVVNVMPATASIGAGETIDVKVTLHPGAASVVGSLSTLTFMALPTSAMGDPSMLGNYAIVEGLVVDKKTAVSVAQGSLITTGTAISENGEVSVWGFRGSGQQGNGQTSVASDAKPEKVSSLSNVVSLVGGAYHLLALDKDGKVSGWGQSGYGETGCKPNSGIYTYTPCTVLANAIQIAAGEYFSIALDKDGKVWTWGHNLYGQLGNGNSKNSQEPVNVNLNGEKARLIGGAYESAFVVTEEGHVWAWGDNEASGLGIPGTNYGVQQIVRTPTLVPNLTAYASRITYIAGGNGWGEALLDDGAVIGWGLRAALGQGTTATSASSPAPVEILRNVKQLYARYIGSVALTEDGKVFTWGQTGGSAFPMIYGASPTQRLTAGSVKEIGGGKEHVFYKTEDGKLYGVGYNDLYKLNMSKCCAPNVDWPGVQITY